MRGLVVPDSEEDFSADQVELYFDLAFVFAFAQLVSYLHAEHSLEGVARASLLFLMVWLPWTQFTWSANAISSSARVVRFLFLVATVATMPMAASTKDAFGDGGLLFALSMATIFLMAVAALVSGLWNMVEVRASAIRYSIPITIAIVLFAAGGLVPGNGRILVWLLAVAVFIYSTTRAGEDAWLVRPGHFAERHGLILIIALGEVMVAIGLPVADAFLDGETVGGQILVALVLAGVFAGLLWWSYFDRVAPALEYRAEQTSDPIARGRLARDAYSYCHYFIVGGVILAAAALEEITLHPDEPLDGIWRWMLFIGLAAFLLGIVAAVWRAFGMVARERLIAVVLVGGLMVVGRELDGILLLAVLNVILAGMVVTEHQRIEG